MSQRQKRPEVSFLHQFWRRDRFEYLLELRTSIRGRGW